MDHMAANLVYDSHTCMSIYCNSELGTSLFTLFAKHSAYILLIFRQAVSGVFYIHNAYVQRYADDIFKSSSSTRYHVPLT